MSTQKYYTVRVVLVDLLPREAYISGSTYDGHKQTVTQYDINMDENSIFLSTSLQDLVHLCYPFEEGWEEIFFREDNVASFFNHVVRTAVDVYLPKAIRPPIPIRCAEFVLIHAEPGTVVGQPRTLWCKKPIVTKNPYDNPMNIDTGVYVYSGDVIEIRAVQVSRPMCFACLHAPATFVLDPCGHFGMCTTCCKKWQKESVKLTQKVTCPVCRQAINNYIDIWTAVEEKKISVTVCANMSIESLLQEFARTFV